MRPRVVLRVRLIFVEILLFLRQTSTVYAQTIFSYPNSLEQDLECRLTGQNCDPVAWKRAAFASKTSLSRRYARRSTNARIHKGTNTLSVAHSLFDEEKFDEASNALNQVVDNSMQPDGPLSQTIARGRLMIALVEERISITAKHNFGGAFTTLARYNLAVKALRGNMPQKAMEHLDHVVKNHPLFAPALYNYGISFYQTGNLNNALHMFYACNRSLANDRESDSGLAAAALRNIDLILASRDGDDFVNDHGIKEYKTQQTGLPMLENAVIYSLRQLGGSTNTNKLKFVCVELGVWRGDTLRRIASAARGYEVHGFDSFLGLPSNFAGGQFKRGAFSTQGSMPPRLPINVDIHAGWFNSTIPSFVDKLRRENMLIAFVHLDCDLYESAREALELLLPLMSPRAVIQFDQFMGYPGWRDGEARAWWEIADKHKIDYEYIWRDSMRVTVQIMKARI